MRPYRATEGMPGSSIPAVHRVPLPSRARAYKGGLDEWAAPALVRAIMLARAGWVSEGLSSDNRPGGNRLNITGQTLRCKGFPIRSAIRQGAVRLQRSVRMMPATTRLNGVRQRLLGFTVICLWCSEGLVTGVGMGGMIFDQMLGLTGCSVNG